MKQKRSNDSTEALALRKLKTAPGLPGRAGGGMLGRGVANDPDGHFEVTSVPSHLQ